MRKIFKTCFIALALFSLTTPLWALAQNNALIDQQTEILNQIGSKSNYGAVLDATEAQNALANRIGNVATIILGFLGVIFLFFVTYSGIQWMTAGGNEERITKAKNRMVRAAVGLIIVVSAYAISTFVIDKVSKPSNAPSLQASCETFSNETDCNANVLCTWQIDTCVDVNTDGDIDGDIDA